MPAARPGSGLLIWRLFPAHTGVAGVATPYDDWIRALDRGWIRINGCYAHVTEEAYLDEPGWIRFRIVFKDPYPHRHP